MGSADDPCEIKVTGTWAEGSVFSISPKVPNYSQPVTLDIAVHIHEDLYFATYRLQLKSVKRGIIYEHREYLCMVGRSFCPLPLRKGRNLTYHNKEVWPSAILEKGVYTGFLRIFNEDQDVIIDVHFSSCPYF